MPSLYNFNKIVDRTGTSSVKYDLREEIFKNKNVIPMWVADMDFETPDFILNAIRKRINHPILGYSFNDDSFKQSVVRWLKKRHNFVVKKEWICYSPGVVPGLNLSVLAYTKEYDNIIVQPPVYFPFFNAVKDHKRNIAYNQLLINDNKYFIDFEDLEKKAELSSMIFLSSPHNPCSRIWTKQELEKLANICINNNVVIISDEIHNDLILEGKHCVTADISNEIAENTVTFIAPSKTFNIAGLSTSVAIIKNKDLREKYNEQLNNFHIGNGNIFGNLALKSAYNNGEKWLEQLLDYLRSNADYVKEFLKEHLPKIKMVEAEATYLLWLDFREFKMKNKEINSKLINEAGLGLSDGRMFGPGGNGFFRLNIACPKSILEKAMNNIKFVFSEL